MPESSGYALSEKDLAVIKQLVADYRNRPQNTTQRSVLSIEREESLAPEIYVAKTPPTGIPAMGEVLTTGTGTETGDTGTGTIADDPGFADCDVYRLDFQPTGIELEIAGFSELVFNLSTSSIAGNSFILIAREKFGYWFVLTGEGGGFVASDHFVAKVSVNAGGGAYTIIEQYPPGTDFVGQRIVASKEINGNALVDIGKIVMAFVFNVAGVISYYFNYCCVPSSDVGTSTVGTSPGTGTGTFFVPGTTLCGGVAIPNTLYMTVTNNHDCPDCGDLVVPIFNVTGGTVWSTLSKRVDCCNCTSGECSFLPSLAFECVAGSPAGTVTGLVPAEVFGVTPSTIANRTGSGSVSPFVEFFFYDLAFGIGAINIVVTA